jgi:arylsulfatase
MDVNDSILSAEDFEDSYIGRHACEWVEINSDDFPWYLFVGFVGPHDPYDPPAEYAERCRKAEAPEPIDMSTEGKPWWIAKTRRYCI